MYVLLLAISSMIAVVGLSAVMLSRSNLRSLGAARDSVSANAAAAAGLEYAIGVMNSSPNWSTEAKNMGAIGPVSINGAKVKLYINDELDGILSNDPSRPVRVYSVATVGGSTRCFSMLAAPISNAGYDVLRCPLACAGTLTTTANLTASGGPVSSNTDTINSATVRADLETGTLSSTGFVAGLVKVGMPAKTMPPSTAWTSLSAVATTISYASMSGSMDRVLLSSKVNPWGAKNNDGIYAINVPAGSRLTIRRSRLVATLLVTLNSGSELLLRDENLWDPGASTQPTLLVSGSAGASVVLGASTSSLSELANGTNYNPSGNPYNGSDSDTLDTYPNEMHGLVHILSGASVTLTSNLNCIGSIIAGGPVTIDSPVQLTQSPALLTNPPVGYVDPAACKMQPASGSFRWQVADVNP